MTRERAQLWIAATCALGVHVALFATADAARRRGWGGATAVRASASPVSIAPPTTPVAPLAEPPKQALGEWSGQGDAISSVDRPDPAKSEQVDAFEQAWTRQKHAPLPPPAAQRVNASTPTDASESDQARQETSLGPLSVIGATSLSETKAARDASVPDADPEQSKSIEGADDVATSLTKAEQGSAEQASQSLSTAPPDVAEKGESDLDPFPKADGVTFAPGKVEARGGREVKLTRPRIDLAFMADATRLPGKEISITLSIATDATGHPARVEVHRSSDSAIIDDAVRLAAYDSWFGGTMPDRFLFTVTFVRR